MCDNKYTIVTYGKQIAESFYLWLIKFWTFKPYFFVKIRTNKQINYKQQGKDTN